nr:MAG TPA: hypothetical protein [Caudoviricetes sp.]
MLFAPKRGHLFLTQFIIKGIKMKGGFTCGVNCYGNYCRWACSGSWSIKLEL